MSNIKGTNVASPIVPFTTEDTYATHYALYGKGGYRTVQTIAERDAIPEARLEEGMLAYVVEDPDNIHTYQYINSEWTKSKIGSGVEKVETIQDRDSLVSEEGDIVYVNETGELYTKLGDDFWQPLSLGIPIFTKQQEDALQEIGKLPDDYISIPDPGELDIETETTEYESTGRGYYLDIIFSTLRALQAEVAKLRNSFNYGINSYTGKETAMGRVVGSYEIPEQEPLWDVDEADLSPVNVNLDLNDNNTLEPSENVSIGDKYLIIDGTASWTDPEMGYISVDDTKLYLYLTTNSLNFSVTLTGLNEEVERTKTLNFSTMELKHYGSSKYNIMICLSRVIVDMGNTYGKNFVWVSVGNYVTGGAEDMGYWNPSTNKLQKGLVQIDDRYTISNVSFTNLNLYKFNGYSKYQDLSSTVDPITPTDDGYKYRVAHITIRSVKDEDELMSIKNQLPANELIYNEQTGVLWIKTSSGTVRPISGSGGQQEDDGMTKEETKQWLELNGIIVSDDGSKPIELNKVADITFIHQETGKTFTFSVNSEGELVSEEAPEITLKERLEAASYTPTDQINNLRGFVGSLGYKEKYGKSVDPNTDSNSGKDLGLFSDRVKIGSIYSPYSKEQPSYGCSHAFIELENTSDRDFPLDGCYLHYATGTTSSGVEDVTVYHLALRGVIPAGGTYLIRGKKYSDFDQANTFIKVETFDQEWYVEKNEIIELIDLTQNNNNSYLLTYGLPEVTYTDTMFDTNSGSNSSNFPYFYESHYIDSVSIRNPIQIDQATPWQPKESWFSLKGMDNLDIIFKNTFELDPAKQAYQSCNTKDSSRCRNTKAQDFQYLVLKKDVIEFPKSSEIFPIEKYTPKASWQHKNVCTDKTKLDKNRPNMVTVSFGINMYTTRCFNWISCGYFDEFIWIRQEGQTEWQARFESYKSTQEDDDAGTSGMTKKTFGTFYNHRQDINNENYPIQNVIYNRISGTFPADGTKYTSHKCIVNIVQEEATTGKVKYEYIVGRADKNLNPDPNHTSEIQTFTLYSKEYTPRIFQITDQQGFHWIEYQVWSAAAEEVNNTINELTNDPNSKIMPVLVNTGDMTQNGTRINEWYDYYTGGYCLFNHLEQANVVGNNDLCNTNPEELGTGDDYGKSNGFYFHVFYCYEIDENILPIISNPLATNYIPSLYYFQDKDYRFVMLNTEITTINCNDWFGQRKDINGESHVVNVYTGWTIRNSTSEVADQMVYDNSFTTIYSMVYNMLDTQKDTIVACHEMPFTVVTNSNLKIKGSTSPQEVDRSLDGATNNLVGCHCNRLSNLDVKGIYWLSRLLEHSGIKLCIGGHKHTYACTNPVREFYYYDDNGVRKNSIEHGKMNMEPTLEHDSAIWETTLYATDGTGLNYTIGGSGATRKFNTTKFPIMVNTDLGVNMPDSSTYYPYYGVSEFPGSVGDKEGVVYFMCQATGYKQKSNKELPSNNQKFSYVIPKTNNSGSSDKPSDNQLFPMFSEIVLNGNKSYTIYLCRIRNIMMNGSNGMSNGKFSQTEYSTEPIVYNWLKGNEQQGSEDKIYGNWGYNVKTALITIS